MKKAIFNRSMGMVPMLIFLSLFTSCNNNGGETDAYGNFEADEVIVSAQSQGTLLSFNIKEGDKVLKDQIVGRIDSSSAALKKNQLLSQYTVIAARLANLEAQLQVQQEQRINIVREVERMEKLLYDKAATQQQYDDVSGKLKVLDSQTRALESQQSIIRGEKGVLNAQIEEVNNLLEKCRIISPLNGVVLEKYALEGELVSPGKALFKVANIEDMELKVYVSESQLSAVKIGDSVAVSIDNPDGSLRKITGSVAWISSQVEFTPKIIQTREERVNMVYGVKIRVKNDGSLKIGMPGEVDFLKD